MKTRLNRFFRQWMIVAAPLALFGWSMGAIETARHAYRARGLIHLADFTLRKFMGHGLTTALCVGFWFAALLLAVRTISKHRRRGRRAFGLLLVIVAAGLAAFVAWRLPTWRFMAKNAAYGGHEVNLIYGVLVLAVVHTVQATRMQRLIFITVAGISVLAAGAVSALAERGIFRADPGPEKERKQHVRLGWAAALINGLIVVRFFLAGGVPEAVDRPPVVWISIDTLRADHLGMYGYERPTSPNLDALAAEGTRRRTVHRALPWTLPTHASMFLGLDPSGHGMTTQQHRFGARTPLFPEVLKDRGYRSGAVVTSLLLSPTFGFAPGFDKYEMNIEYNAGAVVDRGLEWIGRAEKPTFLFLHFFDPHFPYGAPPGYYGRFGPASRTLDRMQGRGYFELMNWVMKLPERRMPQVLARYDEEIAYTDDQIGRLFTELKRRGVYDRAWIVVVADHGEEFLDHGSMGHSATMYDELMRVPMIVKAPGAACGGTRLRDGQVPQRTVAQLILAAAEPVTGDVECDPATGAPAILADLARGEPVIGDARVFGPVRFMVRVPDAKLLSPVELDKGGFDVHHEMQLSISPKTRASNKTFSRRARLRRWRK
ncbi:MAG: sulfatase [Deltaproteobacteria bacterium]|nr:sulfatase [Deltaproteobacteria bacterium]